VRQQAGLVLQGTTYDEDGSWLVVDAKMADNALSVRDAVLQARAGESQVGEMHVSLVTSFC
jgi:hypothetical protein